MQKDDPLALGQIAVKRGFLSEEQLTECQGVLDSRQSIGAETDLLEIAQRRGYLTGHQTEQIKQEFDRHIRKKDPIPGFKLLSEIGRGGMGQVYKGIQLSLDRPVAVKVLPSRLAKNPSFVERFHREARSAGKLIHPNVVQVIEAGKSPDNHYYLVMEFVEGENVHQMLQKRGRIEEKDALRIIHKVAEALQEAHRLNIIHRDIKPSNILINDDGEAKLADFGLAREESDNSITLTGQMMGTPYYMSPEQARGDRGVDSRADLYSLGATFYHMITGRLPFKGDTPTIVVLKHIEEPVIPPKEHFSELSEGVNGIILRMMEKDPGRRYATPQELIEDLDAFESGQPVGSQAATTATIVGDDLADNGDAAPAPIIPGTSDAPVVSDPFFEEETEPQSSASRTLPMFVASAVSGFVSVVVVLVIIFMMKDKPEIEPGPPRSGPPPIRAAPDPARSRSGPPPIRPAPEFTPEQNVQTVDGLEGLSAEVLTSIKAAREFVRKQSRLDIEDRDFVNILARMETLLDEIGGHPVAARIRLERMYQIEQLDQDAKKRFRSIESDAGRAVGKRNYGDALLLYDRFPKGWLTQHWQETLNERKDFLLDEAKKKVDVLSSSMKDQIDDENLSSAKILLENLNAVGLPFSKEKAREFETKITKLEKRLEKKRLAGEALLEEQEAFTKLLSRTAKDVQSKRYSIALRKIKEARSSKQYPNHSRQLQHLEANLTLTDEILNSSIVGAQEKIRKDGHFPGRVKGIGLTIFKLNRDEMSSGATADAASFDNTPFQELHASDIVELAHQFYRPPAVSDLERTKRLVRFGMTIEDKKAFKIIESKGVESAAGIEAKAMAIEEIRALIDVEKYREAEQYLVSLKALYRGDLEIHNLLDQVVDRTEDAPVKRPEKVKKAWVKDLFYGKVEVHRSKRRRVQITYTFQNRAELQDWVIEKSAARSRIRRKVFGRTPEDQPNEMHEDAIEIRPRSQMGHKGIFTEDDLKIRVIMVPVRAFHVQFASSRPNSFDGIRIGWPMSFSKGGRFMGQPFPKQIQTINVILSRDKDSMRIEVEELDVERAYDIPDDANHSGHLIIRASDRSLHIRKIVITGELDRDWLESALEKKQVELSEEHSVAPVLPP